MCVLHQKIIYQKSLSDPNSKVTKQENLHRKRFIEKQNGFKSKPIAGYSAGSGRLSCLLSLIKMYSMNVITECAELQQLSVSHLSSLQEFPHSHHINNMLLIQSSLQFREDLYVRELNIWIKKVVGVFRSKST